MGGKTMEEIEKDRKEGVSWLFCLVFPNPDASHKKYDELVEAREAVLDDLAAAKLQTQLFSSSTTRQIFCKVGATDSRLLREADIQGYKLLLNEAAIKQVAESDLDEEKYGRGPLYLDYPFPAGTDVPFDFKYKGLDGSWKEMAQTEVAKYIEQETKMSPWANLYVRYNDAWEHRILADHGVQVYETYGDGTILRPADRIKLIGKALQRSSMKDPEHQLAGAGLDTKKRIYAKEMLAAYPLQLGTARESSKEMTPDQLKTKWWGSFFKPWNQPLDDIRDYAGEKVALYFAFLGHYTKWLVPPAVIGTAIFIHQLFQMLDKTGSPNLIGPNSAQIFNSTDPITGDLVFETELYTQVIEAPAFALFISLWASVFIEFWKRKEASLSLKWGMSDFEQEVGNRVQFKSTHIIPDPVDGQPIEYYSKTTFLGKIAASASVILFCIVIVLAAIGGILVLKVILSAPSFENSFIPADIAPQLALVINAVAIIILGNLYKTVARTLTDWENHRTNIQWEDALIAKTFVFSFVNSYATLTYFAFIKSGRDIVGITQVCITSAEPLLETLTGAEKEALINADACYGSLAYSLFIIFGTQIVVGNIQEVGIPFIMGKVKAILDIRAHAKALAKKAKEAANEVQVGMEEMGNAVGDALGVKGDVETGDVGDDAEEKVDIDLDDANVRQRMKSPLEMQFYLKDYESPFDDYLELAIQFGYVSLFVAAFPVAPLLALINNFIEVRVDSYKVCILSRRPALVEAQDIGTWRLIFQIIGFAAVLSNASVILFSSNIIDVEDDRRVWLWVAFVASVMSLKTAIDFLIPDVPTEVTIQLKRQEFITRKVFALERDDEVLTAEEKRRISRKMSVNRQILPCDPYVLELAERTAALMQSEMGANWTWEQLFEQSDSNSDGTLTLKELRKALIATPLSEHLSRFELQILVSSLDVDGDGTISKAEFRRFMGL